MDLTPLLSPRSVAIIGASQKARRGTGAVRNLLELGFSGQIYPVNPKYESVLGLPCYPNLKAIPGPVDLVAIGIPGEHVIGALEEAHAKQVPAAVIFASGFGEAGETGRLRQAELEAFAQRTGMLICGPNCLGIINFQTRAAGYSSTTAKDVATGNVAVVSQSGTIIVGLVRSLRGIGFSHLISCGNEVGVVSADYLRHLVDQPSVRVLGAFLEDIKRPEKFIETTEAARRQGKPLIVVKTGRSELGKAASLAHTGSLAGSHEVQRAVFRQKGVVHCDDLDEWIEAIEIFRYARPPRARGLGIIGLSGGENALALDYAAEFGLTVPSLSAAGKQRLVELLPWYARPENPIDATGTIGDDPGVFRRSIEVLAAEPDIGVIAISQDSPAHFDVAVAKAVAEAAASVEKPMVFFSNISGAYKPEVQKTLRDAGVPYLQGVRESLKAIGALIEYHLGGAGNQLRREPATDSARRAAAETILNSTGTTLTEDAAKALLGLYRFPIVAERLVSSPDEAARAAEKLGFPMAAKIVSPDIPHKAAIGGVHLNLRSPEEVRGAVEAMRASASKLAPQAQIAGFVVQPMITDGVEVILGVKRDAQFGNTVVFGLGGIFVEAVRQFSIRVAPLSESDANAMILEVPAFIAILKKFASDMRMVSLVTSLLLQLSDLAMELKDRIEEVDINPIILDLREHKATVVDALVVKRRAPS